MASLSLRICLDPCGRIGPGKIALLDEIGRCGSISGAGRSLAMSYRRAWDLVEDMNKTFASPVVASHIGGHRGGGATLTPFGRSVVSRYRAILTAADEAVRRDLDLLQAAVETGQEAKTSTEARLVSTSRLPR